MGGFPILLYQPAWLNFHYRGGDIEKEEEGKDE
jgi:hypothetical protein